MSELQDMARDILRTIELEDFEYDYKNGGYREATIAKFVQKILKM